MDEDAPDPGQTEEERVRLWRVEQLLDLEYSDQEAFELADLNGIHHAIGDLIAAGCPHELARRIAE